MGDTDLRKQPTLTSSDLNTGRQAVVGTDMDTGRASEASSVPTYTNLVVSETMSWQTATVWAEYDTDGLEQDCGNSSGVTTVLH